MDHKKQNFLVSPLTALKADEILHRTFKALKALKHLSLLLPATRKAASSIIYRENSPFSIFLSCPLFHKVLWNYMIQLCYKNLKNAKFNYKIWLQLGICSNENLENFSKNQLVNRMSAIHQRVNQGHASLLWYYRRVHILRGVSKDQTPDADTSWHLYVSLGCG